MAIDEITRIRNFSIESYLENTRYGAAHSALVESDLLLLPYAYAEPSTPPAFLIESYDRIIRFKDEYKQYKVQPIFSNADKPNLIVFNGTSIYLGSFIITSILAPIFVNWLSSKIAAKDGEKVNITIIIYDKGEDECTRFEHNEDIKHFQNVYVKRIDEYSSLKKIGKLNAFDEKYLGKTIDFKA